MEHQFLIFHPIEFPNNQKYRHPGDRISMFDAGAVNGPVNAINGLIIPHPYDEYPNSYDDDDRYPPP